MDLNCLVEYQSPVSEVKVASCVAGALGRYSLKADSDYCQTHASSTRSSPGLRGTSSFRLGKCHTLLEGIDYRNSPSRELGSWVNNDRQKRSNFQGRALMCR